MSMNAQVQVLLGMYILRDFLLPALTAGVVGRPCRSWYPPGGTTPGWGEGLLKLPPESGKYGLWGPLLMPRREERVLWWDLEGAILTVGAAAAGGRPDGNGLDI